MPTLSANLNDRLERQLQARMSRRLHAQDRALARLERREHAAQALVGQLMREGRLRYYINLRPLSRGRILEASSEAPLIDYLVRNDYV